MNKPECAWCFEPITKFPYRDPEHDLLFCSYECAKSYCDFENQFETSNQGDE